MYADEDHEKNSVFSQNQKKNCNQNAIWNNLNIRYRKLFFLNTLAGNQIRVLHVAGRNLNHWTTGASDHSK